MTISGGTVQELRYNIGVYAAEDVVVQAYIFPVSLEEGCPSYPPPGRAFAKDTLIVRVVER
jgi:hypothetical protein